MHNETSSRLRKIPTGTIATVLRQKGVHRVWMDGPRPLLANQERVAGPALTVRFVPAREDITTSASLSSPDSFRAFIDEEHPGCVVVASVAGVRNAGVVGDILATRLAKGGVVGLITDGFIRDRSAVVDTGLSIWAEGSTAPPSVAGLHYCGTGDIVSCGGVTVVPGDFIVADGDGAVVVPAAMASEVASEAEAKEHFESWVFGKVKAGECLVGLYPPSPETKKRYEAERSEGA